MEQEAQTQNPEHPDGGQALPNSAADILHTEETSREPEEPLMPPKELLTPPAGADHAKPGVHIRSRKALFRIGLIIAILNPVVSGLLIGIYFWQEPELRREGKIITAVSLVWGAMVLFAAFAAPAKGLDIFSISSPS